MKSMGSGWENLKIQLALKGLIDCHLVILVGKAPVYRVRGLGPIPSRTYTQGPKVIEEKVLPLL